MNVKIQSVKFDADKKLIEFIENKMAKLERFVDRATGAEVILKIDKDPEQGNKVATIKIEVPTETLVAEHQSKSFEEAIDEAIDALKKQLEKHKEKFAKESNLLPNTTQRRKEQSVPCGFCFLWCSRLIIHQWIPTRRQTRQCWMQQYHSQP